MRYPCKLIQDILPLYHDGVCSQESKEIVEQHLSDCEECRKYYDDLCGVDAMEPDRALNKENEMKKAESFKGKEKTFKKTSLIDSSFLCGILCTYLFCYWFIKTY